MKVKIVERSLIARIAAWKLGTRTMAVTIGYRIYLHGIHRSAFLTDEAWVKHELAHVQQYKNYGLIRFLVLYLFESMRKGYFNNKFEVAARKAELQSSQSLKEPVVFI